MDPLPGIAAEHLMRAFNTVLAWDSSAKCIYNWARILKEKNILLFHYRNPQVLKPEGLDADKVLSMIKQWEGPRESHEVSDAKHIISRVGTAKVHAEAALMDLVISSVGS